MPGNQQPDSDEADVAERVGRLQYDPFPGRFAEVRAATDINAKPAAPDPQCQQTARDNRSRSRDDDRPSITMHARYRTAEHASTPIESSEAFTRSVVATCRTSERRRALIPVIVSGMGEVRTYPHGVTSWIDIEQPDLEAARAFYAGLFGWTMTDASPPEAPGSYLIATIDGQDVAALAPTQATTAQWNTYVAVDNADTTAAAVTANGGEVIAPPRDAGAAGRAAVCADPFGAEFRLWQAGHLRGAQRTNSPGAWNFSDLYTPDREAAMAFYTPLFGWRAADLDQNAGTMLQVPGYGDHLAATVDPGIHERQASAPAGFADVIGGLVVIGNGDTARWHVIFTVADRDDSAATAERLGATVVSSSDNMWTKNALLRDPQGAELTVSQFSPPEGDW
jgi:uncharacterized protein